LTPKKVFSADFREIPAVDLTCKCGGSISIPIPRNLLGQSLECPGCHQPLWNDDRDPLYRILRAFVSTLSEWKKLDSQDFKLGFSITVTD